MKKLNKTEVSLAWFGKTLWRFVHQYMEFIFLAICLRLIDIIAPFIFQVLIDRILPFHRVQTLIVVVVIFGLAGLLQMGFTALSGVLGALTANREERGARLFDHLSCRLATLETGPWVI